MNVSYLVTLHEAWKGKQSMLFCLSCFSHFQDSNRSTFSRSSVRSSKRLKKEGETGYTKPGPPTPGRNKSLGNLSLPKINPNTSSSSLETTTSCPGVGGNTPDMSRVSAR